MVRVSVSATFHILCEVTVVVSGSVVLLSSLRTL